MTNILFITGDEKEKGFLSRILGSGFFILTSDNEEEVESLATLADLIIVDFSSLEGRALSAVRRIKELDASAIILGVGKRIGKEIIQAAQERGLSEYVDMEKDISFLGKLARQKMKERVLVFGTKEGRLSQENSRSVLSMGEKGNSSPEEYRVLEEMAHFLVHGYNLKELVQFVLSFLHKMFRISRLCFVLKDRLKETYRVEACLGMSENIKKYVELSPERGLVKFLSKKGITVNRGDILRTDFETAYEVKQEMKAIRSDTVVPVSPRGELIGILGLGPKITGGEMSKREIEQIFLLGNQLGLAIQNLLFYKEMGCQKEYMEDVLEGAASGVISIGAGQRIVTYNSRAREILNLDGYLNLTGKDIRELPSPLGDILFETFTQGTSYKRKEVYVSALKRWLGVSTSQVKDSNGEVSGSMMVFTDITPVKRLQEEKEKTQKRDFLGQVAVRLSHELRNSLVPIKSLIELLPTRYSEREFQEKLFYAVTKEMGRMENLVERLVFFSQPLYLEKRAESLPTLISETVEKVKKQLSAEKEIKVSLGCKEENLQVYVDKKIMIEAFGHIISNSVEAMVGGVVEIDINCGDTDKLPKALLVATEEKSAPEEAGEYVKIEIRDEGRGLPEEATEDNIFDPFFTTKNRGIGLGLTISQSVIKEHGGSIVPLNETGKGMTMTVYLPRYRVPR